MINFLDESTFRQWIRQMDFVGEKTTKLHHQSIKQDITSLVSSLQMRKKQKKNNSQTVIFFHVCNKNSRSGSLFLQRDKKIRKTVDHFRNKNDGDTYILFCTAPIFKEFPIKCKVFYVHLRKVSPSRWNHSHISP